MGRLVFVDGGGNTGHGRQVITLVHLAHIGRQGAPHDEPHDDFCTLHASQAGQLCLRHAGELFGVVFDQVKKLLVPRGVVKTCALPMYLVRQAPRGHHRNLDVVRETFDGTAQRLPELVATPRRRHRELQHPHLQRNNRDGPGSIVMRAQHRQW